MNNSLIKNSIFTGTENTLIGINAGKNITSANKCLCIGKDSGLDITDQSNQIRIGDNANSMDGNMVVFQNGRIVINPKIYDFIFPK